MKDQILIAHLDGSLVEVGITHEQTILDALRDAGYHPPCNCLVGVCRSCIALCEEGTVEMEPGSTLDDAEIEAGQILTCQARARSASVTVRYHFHAIDRRPVILDAPE